MVGILEDRLRGVVEELGLARSREEEALELAVAAPGSEEAFGRVDLRRAF